MFAGVAVASAQLAGVFSASPEHPAIGYPTRPTTDSVFELNDRVRYGKVQLEFSGPSGYLRSVLHALNVPVESQMAVFSKTSLQRQLINPRNPRTIFFNDSVAVAWVPGEPFLEIAAHDPQQGVIFYTLNQLPGDEPRFSRRDDCLTCHETYATLDVPGLLLRSVFPAPGGQPVRPLGDFDSDHRSPYEQRWGGWYVTGKTGSLHHLGNTVFNDPDSAEPRTTLDAKLETATYLSPYSDAVALMVFNHQTRMIDLLTRFNWEMRVAAYTKHPFDVAGAARELADYMLFADEAPLHERIEGTSGFSEKFAARGPRDSAGRSLRQFDLERRLMRYPCSYMIYTEAFDGLPAEAKEAVYKRMWQILSGGEKGAKYARLSLADRRAIIEILRATKKGLPEYFKPLS